MFQIETISAKMLDYYVERSDAGLLQKGTCPERSKHSIP